MFRVLVRRALQCSSRAFPTQTVQNATRLQPIASNFSTLLKPFTCTTSVNSPLLSNPKVQEISNNTQRSLTKYTLSKGKRRTCKAVLKRFYRLDWGGWIRTKCGRNKKIWQKHPARKRRLRQHVFCNGAQNTLLDKMVCKYWRKPKYYVDDPYEPYHSREEFKYTYTKPKPYFPPQGV